MFLFFYRSKVIVHVQNSKFKTFTFSLYTFYFKEINNHKNLKPLIYVPIYLLSTTRICTITVLLFRLHAYVQLQ